MADSIGSFTFDRLEGALDRLGLTTRIVTRPNASGEAAQPMGMHARESELTSMVGVGSGSAGETLMDGYKALQGTEQTITLVGVSRGSFLIHEVVEAERRNVVNPVGGSGGTHWVVARWRVQKVRE